MNSESIERVYRFCPRCGKAAEEEGKVPFRCKPCGFAHFSVLLRPLEAW